MRHFIRLVLIGMLVGLSMSATHAVGQEQDTPVLEQLLDLLLQRGQITREQYHTLQEQARKEQRTGVQVGLDHGRPFLQAADGKVRFDLGGRFQFDFDRAEDGARTLTGSSLGSQFLVRRARFELNGQFFQWIDLKIEPDFTDSQPLRDVYLDLKFFPELRLPISLHRRS